MKPRLSSPETRRRAFVDKCIANGKTCREGPWRDLMLAVAAIGPNATTQQIDAIHAGIGGPPSVILTTVTCNGCDREVECAVKVGQEDDYESATCDLCADCLREALAVLEDAMALDKSMRPGSQT